MKKILAITMVLVLLTGCTAAPVGPSDTTESVVSTTAPTTVTDPDSIPADPLPTEPSATQPSVTEPNPTEPVLPEFPTLPDLGEDPGGFGPIF